MRGFCGEVLRPDSLWQGTDLHATSIIVECGKRKPSLDIIAAQKQPGTRGRILSLSLTLRSAAVNATYSEVTARTRVCLHIDITAGRDSGVRRQKDGEGGREGGPGGESRDLIPSKLSKDLLARRDMVMPPLRCSAVSRSAALEGKLNRDGMGRVGPLAQCSLCHCPTSLLCCNNTGKRARGQCTPSVRKHIWH